MRIDIARSVSRRHRRIAGVVAAAGATIALSLASAAPASAIGPSATLAPIGTGSYLLTITTGAEQIESLALLGENITNVAPAGICEPQTDNPICGVILPPMTSKQICYSGPPVTEVGFNLIEQVKVSSAPAVASCPVPGFTPPKTTSPVKCKKGFKKKTVHGKAKCVKIKKHKH